MGRSVYSYDAEDLKAHKWFRGIPWDRLHLITPPFVPQISSVEDTHYFEEEEPISDWSESIPDTDLEEDSPPPDPMAAFDPNPLTMTAVGAMPVPPSLLPSSTYPKHRSRNMAEANAVLATYSKPLREMLVQFVATPYDSTRLKRIHREIEHMVPDADEAARLKNFVQVYGIRERKRPRDRLLRDRRTRGVALEVRKQSAFLGYTWRRMKRSEPGVAGRGILGAGAFGTTGLGIGAASMGTLGIAAAQFGIGLEDETYTPSGR
jgi:protein-serine/threonine kinase